MGAHNDITWLIKYYKEHNRDTLLFEKEYKKVNDITADWKCIKRAFLYNCFYQEKNHLKKTSNKRGYLLKKYGNFVIIKTRTTKEGKEEVFKFDVLE